ncbi:hypothetical protein [Caballeronia sp. S22]|uniref:hypothetical protein n=1 Tax=Caballeronia sp. S22 TaxID=3137182 RepID=UPI0035306B45
MKTQTVLAVVRVETREIAADFEVATGRLLIFEGSTVFEDIGPPDSWMAFASLSGGSAWGTRPTSVDLQTFLERYVASHPRFQLV